MHNFEYLEPPTLAEAIAMLAEHAAGARVLAGGTDLILQMEHGLRRPEVVIYAGRIPELQEITCSDTGGLSIGAGVTLRAVETHPGIRERYTALAEGAAQVGSVQIRNLGTLAGNLCNASPAADAAPAVLALGGRLVARSTRGERVVPADQFWTGPGQTVLAPDELVTAVQFPPLPSGTRSAYLKHALRGAMDLAIVGVAAAAAGNGKVEQVCIALGAVAPTPFRPASAEAALRGKAPSAEALAEAARCAEGEARPITDVRASAVYRKAMVRVLTRRALSRVV